MALVDVDGESEGSSCTFTDVVETSRLVKLGDAASIVVVEVSMLADCVDESVVVQSPLETEIVGLETLIVECSLAAEGVAGGDVEVASFDDDGWLVAVDENSSIVSARRVGIEVASSGDDDKLTLSGVDEGWSICSTRFVVEGSIVANKIRATIGLLDAIEASVDDRDVALAAELSIDATVDDCKIGGVLLVSSRSLAAIDAATVVCCCLTSAGCSLVAFESATVGWATAFVLNAAGASIGGCRVVAASVDSLVVVVVVVGSLLVGSLRGSRLVVAAASCCPLVVASVVVVVSVGVRATNVVVASIILVVELTWLGVESSTVDEAKVLLVKVVVVGVVATGSASVTTLIVGRTILLLSSSLFVAADLTIGTSMWPLSVERRRVTLASASLAFKSAALSMLAGGGVMWVDASGATSSPASRRVSGVLSAANSSCGFCGLVGGADELSVTIAGGAVDEPFSIINALCVAEDDTRLVEDDERPLSLAADDASLDVGKLSLVVIGVV